VPSEKNQFFFFLFFFFLLDVHVHSFPASCPGDRESEVKQRADARFVGRRNRRAPLVIVGAQNARQGAQRIPGGSPGTRAGKAMPLIMQLAHQAVA
jgi:hypothetical protein